MLALVFGLLAAVICSVQAMADETESVFARSQDALNPHTLGLPVGANAPQIQGVDRANSHTLFLVVNEECNPDYYPLLRIWAEEAPEQARMARLAGWKVLYDVNRRLGFSWLLHSLPSVMILDEEGVIVFPCTTYPQDPRSGVVASPPEVAEELGVILGGLLIDD